MSATCGIIVEDNVLSASDGRRVGKLAKCFAIATAVSSFILAGCIFMRCGMLFILVQDEIPRYKPHVENLVILPLAALCIALLPAGYLCREPKGVNYFAASMCFLYLLVSISGLVILP
jgi:hypothetical protein